MICLRLQTRRTITRISFLILVTLIAGCGQRYLTIERHGQIAPLYDGMGPHTRTITTNSPLAQRYFDQGLTWSYAFNHDEAIRSFQQALQYDPDCAMAYWGIALCHGPHINNPEMPAERSVAAWEALQNAVALKPKVSAVERDLIEALQKRYASPAPEDRTPLDKAYAEAMAQVWQKYPRDNDVGTLYTEALMDLHPWDLWTQDGHPKEDTEKIIKVLETVIAMAPNNPGANHLLIHAVEAGRPKLALASADRLCDLVPASGHLLHMPSHIYSLTGQWNKAARQNELAILVDGDYRRISPKQDFYRIYMIHNHHMLSFISMMTGRSELALQTARNVVASIPEGFQRENAVFVDPFMSAPYDALKRFGRWEEMIAEPQPPEYLPITTALYHFNRGVACAALGDLESAEREREIFLLNRESLPPEAILPTVPIGELLLLAGHFLDGEIAYRRGDIGSSVASLRQAVVIEDAISYMEPPWWVQPVRHTLGAVLMSAGRYDEAAEVYREDLMKWPDNGWSLYGLSRCMRMLDAEADAVAYEKRLREVWFNADVPIASSCLCIPKT